MQRQGFNAITKAFMGLLVIMFLFIGGDVIHPVPVWGACGQRNWYAGVWGPSFADTAVASNLTTADPELINSSYFSAERIAVIPESGKWIELGWIKGNSAVGNTNGVVRFYLVWNDGSGFQGRFLGGDPGSPGAVHQYEIRYVQGGIWNIYIDGQPITSVAPGFTQGQVQGVGETAYRCNEMGQSTYTNMRRRDSAGAWHSFDNGAWAGKEPDWQSNPYWVLYEPANAREMNGGQGS